MRSLVTGGAGFIGSWLCRELMQRGHEVVVLDDLSSPNAGLSQVKVDRAVCGSVCSEDDLRHVLPGVDMVFHLAAVVGVERVLRDPLLTLRTNLVGTENVLKECWIRSLPVFVASSSEVYGNGAVEFHEDDVLHTGPTTDCRWSYAVSKMADECLALAYAEKGLDVVVGRFFNVTGPGQSPEQGMVLTRFVDRALRGLDLTVYGDGLQRRCFASGQDVAFAVAELMHRQPEAQRRVVNVGSRAEIGVLELADMVVGLLDSDSKVVHTPYDQAFLKTFDDIVVRRPKLDRLRALLDWTPTRTVESIVLETAEFLRKSL